MGSSGTATLDFGAFPGAYDATIDVTGQASILSDSLVEAWIFPTATSDHTTDEHMLETFKVVAGNVVAGTGFTIYGFANGELNEPLEYSNGLGRSTTLTGQLQNPQGFQRPLSGALAPRIYGQWTIAWVWN